MVEDGVELPGSSYDQLIRIVQGYSSSTAERKLSNRDVEKASGVPHSEVSRNGKFLIQNRILEGGQQKHLTDIGQRLARAYNFDQENEISSIWRTVLAENDFAQKMVSAVRIRRGMDLRDFQSHVAYSAGSNKTNVKTGAATFVRILEISNLVQNDNGIVMVLPEREEHSDVSIPSGLDQSLDGENVHVQAPGSDIRAVTDSQAQVPAATSEPRVDFQLRINVTVNAGVDDLERLPALLIQLRHALVHSDEIPADVSFEQGQETSE